MSGGHTLLLLAESQSKFKILVNTVDQAIGRVIDKVSAQIEIPWTSLGPGDALEKYCQGVSEADRVHLGGPILPGRREFSFSGLHSQVERYISSHGGIQSFEDAHRRALAYSFQHDAFAQLESKVHLALEYCERKSISVNHLVVSGGVASNQYLRQR